MKLPFKFEDPEPIVEDHYELLGYAKKLLFATWWPKDEVDFKFIVRTAVLYTILSYIPVGIAGYIYYKARDEFIYVEVSEGVGAMFAWFWLHVACVLCFRNRKKYLAILDELGDFTVYEKPYNLEVINQRLNYASKFVFYYVLFCLLASVIFNGFIVSCQDNVIDNCGINIGIYFSFFNAHVSPYRGLASFIQAACCFVAITMGFFLPWSVTLLSELLVNRLNHLKRMFSEIPELKTRSLRKQHIKKCVLYHYKILQWGDDLLNASYSFLYFHLAYTSFMLTLILYGLLMAFQQIMVPYFFLWFGSISIVCAFGERLLTCSTDLRDAVYKSIPIDGDTETQKDMLLVLIGCEKNLYLTAGLLGRCTHALLQSIMKTTYSLMTLLIDSV